MATQKQGFQLELPQTFTFTYLHTPLRNNVLFEMILFQFCLVLFLCTLISYTGDSNDIYFFIQFHHNSLLTLCTDNESTLHEKHAQAVNGVQ